MHLTLRNLLLVFCLLMATTPTHLAAAQVESVQTVMSSVFGVSLSFHAEVLSDMEVKAAVVFFQASGDTRTNVGLASVRRSGSKRYALDYTHRMEDDFIPPFSRITFHWELTLADESVFVSPDESADYMESRFEWQTLEADNFRVHWISGDLKFGQEIINIARESEAAISEIIPKPGLGVIDIYVYNDLEVMRGALRPQSEEWVAGHANPKLGVILLALPESPEQRLLAEQRIPHEMMHVLLYQDYPRGYDRLPRWLTEGLASLVERSSNPDYRILLEKAGRERELIPLSALCETFPNETPRSLLAYAESQAFVQYLYGKYGASGLQNLIRSYANGLDCENGALEGLGKSLRRLENEWQRETLSQNSKMRAIQDLLPWLVLLLAALTAPLAALFWSRPSKKTGQNRKTAP